MHTWGKWSHIFYDTKLLRHFKKINLHFSKELSSLSSKFLNFIFQIWNIFVDTFSEMHILFQVVQLRNLNLKVNSYCKRHGVTYDSCVRGMLKKENWYLRMWISMSFVIMSFRKKFVVNCWFSVFLIIFVVKFWYNKIEKEVTLVPL